MNTLLTQLKFLFKEATLLAFPNQLDGSALVIDLTPSTNEKFGHYQFNSAMKLSKELKRNPRQVAEQIIAALTPNDLIEQVEIAGPGFINITLKNEFLSQSVDCILKDPRLGIPLPKQPLKIIVDFSSPNVAKEMHVGHLRSTIIGDCLARLFEFLGNDVLRLNHIGDWGTAFGMLIAYIKNKAPFTLQDQQKPSLSQLMHWYKESKKLFDADPVFKKQSQLEVVTLQQGDPINKQIWELICEISRKAYQEIYDLLDIKLVERGESFYNDQLAPVVDELEKMKLIHVSDGAKCLFVEGFQSRDGTILPLILQKSDGGYTYDTTDMAAIRHRIVDEKADRIIYVVDAGQGTHLQMIFKGAEMAHYLDPKKTRADHVAFGLVLGADGKKFRTRSGETEKLIDLLNAAIEQAHKILLERSPDMDPQERNELAHALGIGAVKYADLSCNRMGDYVFSYERMLRFEGNTAAFLMYSYVRVAGIKRKLNLDIEQTVSKFFIKLDHPSEIALGLHLIQFADTLECVSDDLLPNRLTDYLYSLAEKFNAFFRDCRVEGSPQQNERLLLCETVARVLKQGMKILGLPVVDKM